MPSAEAVVAAYDARPTGSPGWRRVSISLSEGTKVTRTFQVVNVWRDAPDHAEMLFFLEAPEGLKGTRYLQVERPADTASLEVYLFLPSGARVLRIAPGLHGEGLIGSDFAYDDMRTKLPTEGYAYTLSGERHISGKPVWTLEARPRGPDSPWQRAVFYITQDTPFLIAADYFERVDAPPVKQMRVERFRDVSGVRTAELMVMRVRNGRKTSIDLKELQLRLPKIGAQWFSPDSLIRVGPMIEGGWPLRR